MKVLPSLLMMFVLAASPDVLLSQRKTEAPSSSTSAQAPHPKQTSAPAQPQNQPASLENSLEAAEPLPRRNIVRWNEYQGPHFTIRVGGGFLYDFAAFA